MSELSRLPADYQVRAAQERDRLAIRRLLKQFETEIRATAWMGQNPLIAWFGGGLLVLGLIGLLVSGARISLLHSLMSYGLPGLAFLALGLLVITWIWLQQEWRYYWVIEHQGNLIACAKLQRYLQYSVLFDLYVKSDYRRQGVGSALVRSLIDQAQRPLYLACVPARLEFYQRLGFSPIAPKKLPTLLQYDLGLVTRPEIIPLVLQ